MINGGGQAYAFGRRLCFFRRRLALAMARRCHGAMTEAGVTLTPLDMSASPVAAAAAAFSLNIRLYSAGEHFLPAISSARRATVSQDANMSSVIIVGREVVCRHLRGLFMNGLCRTVPGFPGHTTDEIHPSQREGRQVRCQTFRLPDLFM